MSTRRREGAGDGLFVVGVVGRTGSGKSSVARRLAARGAVVIDADALGHEVTDRDPEVRAALEREYGASVYGPGGLDRRRVAAVVFADPAALQRLNRLVHPRLVARVRGRLEALRAQGHRGLVVIDAALLLDWGLERECDAVIAVTAPQEEQLRRLRESRGWSREEALRRLAAQRKDTEFTGAADAVIENSGSGEALDRAVDTTLNALVPPPDGGPGAGDRTC